MPSKKVAVDGEVSASPGTSPGVPNSTGTWTAGNVSYQTYSELTVGGKQVTYEASCTFSYSGADNSSGATVTASSSVTLSAKSTVVQNGANKALVDGDSETDAYGNKLSVSAAGVLQTA
jgi:hypothetical protein